MPHGSVVYRLMPKWIGTTSLSFPAAQALVRSIVAELLHQTNPFRLGHLTRLIAHAALERFDEIADSNSFGWNLLQDFPRFDGSASLGGGRCWRSC